MLGQAVVTGAIRQLSRGAPRGVTVGVRELSRGAPRWRDGASRWPSCVENEGRGGGRAPLHISGRAPPPTAPGIRRGAE